jgi:hypothetical protein
LQSAGQAGKENNSIVNSNTTLVMVPVSQARLSRSHTPSLLCQADEAGDTLQVFNQHTKITCRCSIRHATAVFEAQHSLFNTSESD